ncbi:DNA polymerase delta subunit 3-like [Centruroides vittatus]|uniref:DNA polymerase delta subunit 3-like n=1 Tax=Centruroides vittatus TaxID=120091 RepID=UPI00350F021D
MAGSLNEEEILDRIEVFVIHENKIVTYKWLSKVLSLNCNSAKQYLQKFVNRHQFKVDQLNICYFVAGFQVLKDDSKIYKFIITSEENLEKSKQKFSVLTNVHLYSIHLSSLKDSSSLYTTEVCSDKNFEKLQRCSAIQNKEVKIKLQEEFQKKKPNESNELKSDVKLQVSSNKGKQNELFTLWQKQKIKTTNSKQIKVETTDLRSSLIKSNDDTKKFEDKHLESLNNENKINSAENETAVKGEKVSKTRNVNRKEKSSLKLKRKNNENNSKGETGTNKNKHKRIMVMSTSESESEEDSSDSESSRKRFRFDHDDGESDNLEENPIVNKEKNEDPLPSNSNSKVSYKTVCKTYLDEDGFMVTKKVKECVEEISEEKEILKEKPQLVINKKVNLINKKQSSLMNFFSKK